MAGELTIGPHSIAAMSTQEVAVWQGAERSKMPDFELSYWPADRSRPLVEATLGSLLRDAAEATPDQVALVMGTRDPRKRLRWTYGDVLTRAQRAAHALLAEFEPGTRIAIWAPNVYQFFDVEFGTALAGMTLVPINPAFRAVEARHVLARSQAQGLFFGPVIERTISPST